MHILVALFLNVLAVIPNTQTLNEAADATTLRPAVRLEVPAQQPCGPETVEQVNALPYGWMVPAPAMEAYRVVARCNGWSEETIAAWQPFASDVFMKESGGCWNVRRGDVIDPGTCHVSHHGSGEDSGFAQLTSSLWGPGGDLCLTYGYCSGAQVRSSPWASMDAAVKSFHLYGSQPWCYSARARRFHECGLVSQAFRP